MDRRLMPDLQSFKIVMQQLGAKKYEIIRQESYEFNEFGRMVPITTKQTIYALIVKTQSQLDMKADGDWNKTNYTMTIIYPTIVNLGDKIKYGNDWLKVESTTADGTLSGIWEYRLSRTGATDSMNERNYLDNY